MPLVVGEQPRRRPAKSSSENGRTFMRRASRARRRARSASAARRPAAARAASPSRLIHTVGRPSSVAGAMSWKRLAPTCTCDLRAARSARRTSPSGGAAGLYEPISDATIAASNGTPISSSDASMIVAVGVREDRELPAAAARVLERSRDLRKRLPGRQRPREARARRRGERQSSRSASRQSAVVRTSR